MSDELLGLAAPQYEKAEITTRKPEKRMVKALGTSVVLKKVPPGPFISEGGIYLPETSERTPDEGIIQNFGPGLDKTLYPIEPGDRVAYSRFAGNEVAISQDESVIVIDQLDLRGIICAGESNENPNTDVQSTEDPQDSTNTI